MPQEPIVVRGNTELVIEVHGGTEVVVETSGDTEREN